MSVTFVPLVNYYIENTDSIYTVELVIKIFQTLNNVRDINHIIKVLYLY